jgi:hypothetical protein
MKERQTKLKMKIIWLVILIIAGSCNNGTSTTVLNNSEPGESYCTTLLVIGDDRSGSTSDIRKLTSEDYRLLAETIGTKGGGTIAVCLIGNPHPQSREPFFLSMKSLDNIKPYNPKDTKLTLTEKTQLKLTNEKITKSNNEILAGQSDAIRNFLYSSIEPNVINYKSPGSDHTDLDDAILRINTMVNEPQYKQYDKIIVALISDGKNQPDKKIQPIQSKITNKKAEVYLIGWKSAVDCFNGLTQYQLSSKDAFIEIIKNLK